MDVSSSPNCQRRQSKDLPFYEAPDHVKTSAKIINEARTSLQKNRTGLRSLPTKRPVTPQEEAHQRKLFGERSIRDPTNRPPSAFSLGSQHFDSESRPVSGTRLAPLDHKPAQVDNEAVMAPKPPADPNRPVRRPPSRSSRLLQHSQSYDGLANEAITKQARSGSLTDVRAVEEDSQPAEQEETQRRVHSGPKERTSHVLADNTQPNATEYQSSDRLSGDGEVESRLSGSESRIGSGGSTRVSSAGRSGSAGSRDSGRRESSGSAGRRDSSRESARRESGSAGRRDSSSAGRRDTGSAGRREEETEEEAQYYNEKVAPLLEEMAGQGRNKETDRAMELANRLYTVLDDGNMLGKACKRRSGILKIVFKQLDIEEPRLLLRIARLILALRVSGNNLTNVCKLVFKVSRDEANDSLFIEENLIVLLLETVKLADHVLCSEALVYMVGALKFLSGNPTVIKLLSKNKCIEVVAKLLKKINKTNSENGKNSEHLGHTLVQMTALLRNLIDVGSSRQLFLSNEVIEELCKSMDMYQMDSDLILNISRIFSKLTLHTDCCNALAGQKLSFSTFVQLLNKHQRRQDLVVRIAFVLGNLTAKSDLSRTLLFQQHKSLDILVAVFKAYYELELKLREGTETKTESQVEEGEEDRGASKIEDVLIKIIRVLANLSISEEIGPVIAANQTAVKLLLKILGCKTLDRSEELVLNTVATINNLSFYNVENSAITLKQLEITQALIKFLSPEHKEGLAEATRVLGNLSREKKVRDLMMTNKVAEMMVALLDSDNREVVYTSCGVLINLMADSEKRPLLKKEGGIAKLVEVLRDFSRTDWQLGAMVCQVFWNYSGKITSSNSCFGEQESVELAEILAELLDEETALDPSFNPDFDEETREIFMEVWDTEFCPVATQMLQRIEEHQSNFEPLDKPS